MNKKAHFGGMEVVFLGTSATRPSAFRNCTAIGVKLETESYLFDCGEGAQLQAMKSERFSLSSVSTIFITHMHGDHVFGLLGVLCEVQMIAVDLAKKIGQHPRNIRPIRVFGPPGIADFLKVLMTTATDGRGPSVDICELVQTSPKAPYSQGNMNVRQLQCDQKGVWHIIQDKGECPKTVKAVLIPHKPEMSTLAYAVEEERSLGTLDVDKLNKLGVPPGPIYKEIKKGKTVTLPNGQKIDGKDFLGPSSAGRKLAIVLDTYDSSPALELAQDADLVIHDSTFHSEMAKEAYDKGHSTSAQAGVFARKAGAQNLALTHFSNRYGYETNHLTNMIGVDVHVEEAVEAFGSESVVAAEDFMSIPIIRESGKRLLAEAREAQKRAEAMIEEEKRIAALEDQSAGGKRADAGDDERGNNKKKSKKGSKGVGKRIDLKQRIESL
eukprot:CAMPEP_0167815028 /NCGR_PEP_ID=MMETSP0112_2-20121227/2775_1 /TAXON_ID=91324 /ORGANISM="Lotharella globosa, Strain CCCM811" /LENGTH=438 /DNA_ID=CAMNT_0007714363 /DNA_START=160 /DNA_END=1476 /DNA_ORIENTATION=+